MRKKHVDFQIGANRIVDINLNGLVDRNFDVLTLHRRPQGLGFRANLVLQSLRVLPHLMNAGLDSHLVQVVLKLVVLKIHRYNLEGARKRHTK